MKILLLFVTLLYPAKWRARYGQELRGLLDEVEPVWHDVVDVAKGGLHMRLRQSVLWLAVVFGLAGVCVAGVVAMMLPEEFRAHGVVFMQPRDAASNPLSTLTTTLREGDLRSILDTHNLFPSSGGDQRERLLRRSVRVNLLSKNAFQVSFSYPDAIMAQKVTRDLEMMLANGARAHTDFSTVAYEDPNVPRTSEPPHRLIVAVMGLLAGAMVGTVAGVVRQRLSTAT
jgi:LPS O-antigen subunit length determinant protein (WzzB/FepE family)